MTDDAPSEDSGVRRLDAALAPRGAGDGAQGRGADQKAPTQASGRLRGLLRKLLLCVAAVAVALALAEAALHVLGVAGRPERLVRDPLLGWRNRAGWQGPVFSVNSRGFLGPEFGVPKPAGAVRIVCLGDSCTAADLLADHAQAYPRQLERLLGERHRGRAVEVLNAGVGGYSSFQGRLWLERELLGYEPDAVVVYFGWNDHWPARAGGADKEVSGSWSEHVRAWLSWSRLLHLAVRAWHVTAGRQDVVDTGGSGPVVVPAMDGPRRVSLADYEANLRAIAAAVTERGGQVVLVTAPNCLAMPGADAWSGSEAVKVLVTVHAQYNDIVRKVAREEPMGLVDAAAGFAAADEPIRLFDRPPGDYIHLSPDGHLRLAEAVAACAPVERLFEER